MTSSFYPLQQSVIPSSVHAGRRRNPRRHPDFHHCEDVSTVAATLEIAAYGTPRAFAQTLGETKVADLLQETLDEEGETDNKLTALAETINEEANSVDDTSKNEDDEK